MAIDPARVHAGLASAASPGNTANADIDSWRLTQTCFDLDHVARDETLFALANGALGVNGSLDEAQSPTRATFLSGAWDREPIHYHERHPGFARRRHRHSNSTRRCRSGIRRTDRFRTRAGYARRPSVTTVELALD
jgi:hypothetical protein